jgi:Phage late control gene D protein (GPD).
MITASVETNRGSFAPVEAELRTSRFNEAARLTATLVDSVPPAINSSVSLKINGTLVGRMQVTDSQIVGDGTVKLTARDEIRKLKDATITQDFTNTQAVAVAEAIASAADARIGVIDVGLSSKLSPTFSGTPCSRAIEVLARLTNSVFFVNEQNRLRVVSSPAPTVHSLNDLKPETSAGKLEQPYGRVVVFGSSSISAGGSDRTGGLDAQRLLASEPPSASVGSGGETYRTRVAQATTDAQCRQYAQSLLTEFRRQRAEGTIVALGNADIRPLDVVRLTALDDSPAFLVSEVRHRVSEQDGFVTEITPGRAV